MPLVNRVEAMLLNREQIDVAFRSQVLNCPLVDFGEACELAIIGRDDGHRRVSNLLQLPDVDVVLVLLSLRGLLIWLLAVYINKMV